MTPERRVDGPQRRVLDQDALTAGLLEVLVEDRVRASRFAGTGRLEDDLFVGDRMLNANKTITNASQPKIAVLR